MEDLNFRGLAGGGREAPQIAGRNQVIGVQEEHELAAHVRKRGVPGGAFTAVLLPMNRDRFTVAEEDRWSCVGRAIIDNDEFEDHSFLAKDAVDRIGNEHFGVMDWDDDANERRWHTSPLRIFDSLKPAAHSGGYHDRRT
jgi:hypothetical protein